MRSDLVDTSEAARILGVSPRTVQRYIKAGHLVSPYPWRRPTYLRRADVEAIAGRPAD